MRTEPVTGPLFGRTVLEFTLKPFYRPDAGSFADTAHEIMTIWSDLADMSQELAVLLWIGDGSEILEWQGDMEQPIRWAHTIGFNNLQYGLYPDEKHYAPRRARPFREPVPAVRYRDVAEIIHALREAAIKILDKDLQVGATLDPGPEFVHNPWKYELHRELIQGGPQSDAPETVGFLSCCTELRPDSTRYAGYRDGIPEGTSFGQFLGRQFRLFADALEFDYIWFSNGFGCSYKPWNHLGEVFDGERFRPDRAAETKRRILSFWKDFRAECPSCSVELRGTNFSVGMDLGSDAVPLREILSQGKVALPPNPPWGCRQLGLEIVTYLSRMAGAPPADIPFRFYTNDPWFQADPWWSYYGREPYDIYCPAATCRVDITGAVRVPRQVELLTIDDELGNLVPELAREVTPHLARAFALRPDAPGPLVWVYPFDEYHDLVDERPELLNHPLFHDWFMSVCVSGGLPVNSVIAAGDLVGLAEERSQVLRNCVLIVPIPLEGWRLAEAVTEWVEGGGRALLYGPVGTAHARIRELLHLQPAEPLSGELQVEEKLEGDLFERCPRRKLQHNPLLSGGGVRAIPSHPPDAHTVVKVKVSSDQAEPGQRVYALLRTAPAWNGGQVAWIRGSLGSFGGPRFNPEPEAPERFHNPGEWARRLLDDLGYSIQQERPDPTFRPAMLCLSRHRGAFMIAGHKPDAPVAVRLRFPDGAPLVTERETLVEHNTSRYFFDKTIHHEIRAFVRQAENSYIKVKEMPAGTFKSRCFTIAGLKGADVTIYPYPDSLADGRLEVTQTGAYDTGEPTAEDPEGPMVPRRLSYEVDSERNAAVLRSVSDSITVTW